MCVWKLLLKCVRVETIPEMRVLKQCVSDLEKTTLRTKNNLLQKFKKTPFYIRWGVYPAACFILILVGKFYAKEFVYFQF